MKWLVIYTKSRHDEKVSAQLEKLGVPYFSPFYKSVRQWNDRKKTILLPLFPSYIFIRTDSKTTFYQILQLPGVVTYVKFGKEIAKVSNDVIENLKLVLAGGEDFEVTSDYFSPGEQLKIDNGIFEGVSCEVVNHLSKRKILVRLQILNRNVLATLSDKVKVIKEKGQETV